MTVVAPLFAPARNWGRWPRVAVLGPPGSGRTWTALAMAAGFDAGPVGLIDTHHGAASAYAARFDFHALTLSTFDPAALTGICYRAADEGIGTLVVDSGSPFWSGPGGVLDRVDRINLEAAERAAKTRQPAPGTGPGWNQVNPEAQEMVAALLDFPGPVIVTVRLKVEDWLTVTDPVTGQVTLRPVGTKPDWRDGSESDYDLVIRLLDAGGQTAVVTKTVMPELSGRPLTFPGADLAAEVAKLLTDGAASEPLHQVRLRDWALGPDVPTEAELIARLDALHRSGRDGARVLVDGSLHSIGDVLRNVMGRYAVQRWAMDPARTVKELRERYAKLQAAGAAGAPVRFGDETLPIGDVIRQCAEVLKAAEQAAAEDTPHLEAAA
jgi:hypothetical protein